MIFTYSTHFDNLGVVTTIMNALYSNSVYV